MAAMATMFDQTMPSMLKDTDASAKRFRYQQVYPLQSKLGAEFRGNVTLQFQYKCAPGEFIDFSNSQITVRSQWYGYGTAVRPLATGTASLGAGLTPTATIGDSVAVAPGGWVNAFSTMNLRLNGAQVERSDQPAQQTIMWNSLAKTTPWAQSAGLLYGAGLGGYASQLARQQLVSVPGVSATAITPEISFKPPFGVSGSDKLVKGVDVQLDMVIDPAWGTRMAQMVLNPDTDPTTVTSIPKWVVGGNTQPTAAGFYSIDVQDVTWWLAIYTADDHVPTERRYDIIDVVSADVVNYQINSAGTQQNSFGVVPSSYELVTILQSADLVDTVNSVGVPVAGLKAGAGALPARIPGGPGLSTINTTFAGERLPAVPYSSNFVTKQGVGRVFNDAYLDCTFNAVEASGTFIDYQSFYNFPIWCQKLVFGEGGASDRVLIEFIPNSGGTPAPVFPIIAYTFNVYPLRIVLVFGPSGLVERAIPCRSDLDLENALTGL